MTRRTVAAGAAAALTATQARAAQPPPSRPLRLLILGGTGFIGPHQVRYALSRGHEVTLFNRGRQPQEWPGHVEQLLGDRNGDLKSLEGREWDVCIDNPTTLPAWVRSAGHLLKSHVKHYVFISTISVYARNDVPGADETAAVLTYPGPDPYAETLDAVRAKPLLYGQLKAVSEHEARKQFGEAAVTVIRPGLIVGPGDETDRFTYWPARLANDGHRYGDTVLAPGDGTDPVQFIDARDLAEWTVRMAEQRRAGTFNATGPGRPITVNGMLVRIAAAARVSPTIAWAPLAFLNANGVSAWSDMPVWVPPVGEDAGFTRRSIARARDAGLKFRPLETTTADTLAWFRTLPPERQSELRSGLTPERETALLAKLKSA